MKTNTLSHVLHLTSAQQPISCSVPLHGINLKNLESL